MLCFDSGSLAEPSFLPECAAVYLYYPIVARRFYCMFHWVKAHQYTFAKAATVDENEG